MRSFTVTHRTTYRYDAPVSVSFGEAHLLPRDREDQRVTASSLVISPSPEDLRERVDHHGNRAHHFAVHEPHERLEVLASSVIEVASRQASGQLFASDPWEDVAARLQDPAGAPRGSGVGVDALLEAAEFALPSPHVPASRAAAAYGAPSLRPGRPLLEAVIDLCGRIHADFDFKPGVSTVGTRVDHVLAKRAGVCQDFAHLTIAALRSFGLAARYVSGYLETDPPPGRPKLQGADVSHAWASVFLGGAGWVDIDPTNDQLVGDRHITTAWGRDYGDVTPLKGVIFTDAESQTLEVSVDVRRTPAPPVTPARGVSGAEARERP